MCFAPQQRALFRHLNFQKWREHVVFCTLWLRNVLRATTACTFSTSQLPKVARTCGVLYIVTSKCASRHNSVHFFDISTSKSDPTMVCFVHYDFKMCFAPQRRALFQHLNFQKWSDNGVFCTFWLRNVLRATTACNFSSLTSPDVSAPAALASLLFNPPEPQNHEKTQCFALFRDFPTFSCTCIFFLLTLSLLTLFPADCFFISPYCRKFDFQTSFDNYIYMCVTLWNLSLMVFDSPNISSREGDKKGGIMCGKWTTFDKAKHRDKHVASHIPCTAAHESWCVFRI